MRGRERAAAIDELADELDNVLAAWRFYVEAGDLARVKSMLDPLWTLYDTHGWYHAAIGITKDLLHLVKSGDEAALSSDKAIALRLTLARLLLAVEGYTPRVEDLYRDTLAVASAAGGLPHQVPVLRSLANFHLQVGHMDKVASIGRDILAIADAEDDDGMRIEGLVILGPPTAFMGDIAGGIAQFDRAIGLFDPDRHGRGALRVGPNPVVVAHSIGALFLWMSGYPDTAQRRSAAAIALAERLGHPYSLAYAVFHAAMLDLWSGRIDAAGEQARRVVQIATRARLRRLARERPHPRGRDGRGAGPPRGGPRADRPGHRALREPPHAADLLAAGPRPPGTGARARRPGPRKRWTRSRRRCASPARTTRSTSSGCSSARPTCSSRRATLGRQRRPSKMRWPRRARSGRGRPSSSPPCGLRSSTGSHARDGQPSRPCTTPSPKASRPLPCGTPGRLMEGAASSA